MVDWDASRPARPLRLLLNLAHELVSVGIGLHLHQEAIDTTTPSGRLLFQVRGMVAEPERPIIVERTKVGLARARSQGKRLGRPPLPTPRLPQSATCAAGGWAWATSPASCAAARA
ncbi:MAG: recombinase family protein [Rhodobacteraceae bacterium]|nr:recombinase family protein [Paracoccaceae bacterium]